MSSWYEKRWNFEFIKLVDVVSNLSSITNRAPSSTFLVDNINYYNVDQYQVRTWEKTDTFKNGTYQFNIRVNDGMRIYLDNNIIFSSWKTQNDTDYVKTIDIVEGDHIIKVEYFNAGSGGVAVMNYVLVKETVVNPPNPPSNDPTGSVSPPELPPNVINLRDIIQFSEVQLSRQYVKGTMEPPSIANIGLTNISDTVDVQISFLGIAGITFEPATIEVFRKSTKTVKVHFNPTGLETLQDGINTANCIVKLSALKTVGPDITIVPPPIEIGVPVGAEWYNATTGQFTEKASASAIICPPGSRTYYESHDPRGETCIRQYNASPGTFVAPITPPIII